MAKPPPSSSFPAGTEAALWRGVGARWRQLFGDFNRLGISFEWHELGGGRDIDWAPSFHPDSVELCLNLSGLAEVQAGDAVARFTAGTAGFYLRAQSSLNARRLAGPEHQFITVEYSPGFLEKHLGEGAADVHPLIRRAREESGGLSGVAQVESLSARQRELVISLRQPPVLASAQSLWFQAKAVELMGEFFFQPPSQDELFCHRHQRVARDRIELAAAILRRNLASPPTLHEIGREVGCSPFYLSRTFSKEKGQTIPQFVRQLRLERAAELLRSGDHNVTEVALEVGYNSLSHFSQAFHRHFGCCPGLYPMATPTQRSLSALARSKTS